MKKLAIAILVGLSLTACGSAEGGSGDGSTSQPDTSNQNDNSWFYVHHVPVDGKTVTCLEYDGHGISCDWAKAG